MVAIFLASVASALNSTWGGLCLIQLVFYGSALLGWECVRRGRGAGIFGYAFAFCLANLGFFFGLMRALRSERIVAY